jgi:hypothetical protein
MMQEADASGFNKGERVMTNQTLATIIKKAMNSEGEGDAYLRAADAVLAAQEHERRMAVVDKNIIEDCNQLRGLVKAS